MVVLVALAPAQVASGHLYANGVSYERSTSGYAVRLAEFRFIVPFVRVAPGFGCIKYVQTRDDYTWFERVGTQWLERKDKVQALVLFPLALSVMLAGDAGA
ncbi:hypothetical protein FJY71_08210, partial [candidate division WOR-3 bacterium]|nr:hypothetical protein [candidate division WOR-3 bacterium]